MHDLHHNLHIIRFLKIKNKEEIKNIHGCEEEEYSSRINGPSLR